MKKYEYVGDEERVFSTLGISLKKGDVIESETEINNEYLKEIEEENKTELNTENENSEKGVDE